MLLISPQWDNVSHYPLSTRLTYNSVLHLSSVVSTCNVLSLVCLSNRHFLESNMLCGTLICSATGTPWNKFLVNQFSMKYCLDTKVVSQLVSQVGFHHFILTHLNQLISWWDIKKKCVYSISKISSLPFHFFSIAGFLQMTIRWYLYHSNITKRLYVAFPDYAQFSFYWTMFN